MMEDKWKLLIVYWGYAGIMEQKMEATVYGLGFRESSQSRRMRTDCSKMCAVFAISCNSETLLQVDFP